MCAKSTSEPKKEGGAEQERRNQCSSDIPNHKTSMTPVKKEYIYQTKEVITTTILQWNIRGLRCNRRDFDVLGHEHQPDVVCLQEIKLEHSPPLSHYRCANYTTVISSR